MEELSVEKSNWSELPSHLLDIIMDKLSSPQLLSDYIRFGAVCDSWNSAFCDHDPPPRFPTLLLIVPPRNNQKKTRLRRFYSILDEKKKTRLRRFSISDEKKKTRLRRFYNISDAKMDSTLEEVRMPLYRHCCGSSHGWLITMDHDEDENFAVRLFNPVLSTEILLPSLKTLTLKTEYDLGIYGPLEKAVLSANPLTNPTDYTVMAIYGVFSSLAFFKPGNKRWTCIESPKMESGRPDDFTDVIYCHMYGKFFAVTWDGAVVAVSDDVAGEQGKLGGMITKLVIQPPLSDKIYTFTKIRSFTKKYLIVESSGRGELLKVHRFASEELTIHGGWTHATTGFRVFKLKVTGGAKEEEEYKWQEVKSLGGDSLFLNYNTSISIRASDYPGCKPNSIHFTNDSDAWIKLDIGIFNLEDGSFERHLPIVDGSFKRHLPIAPENTSATVWIQPSLPNKNRRRSSSSG